MRIVLDECVPWPLAKHLAGHKPIEAIKGLLHFVRKYPTNAEMLKHIQG